MVIHRRQKSWKRFIKWTRKGWRGGQEVGCVCDEGTGGFGTSKGRF